MDLWDARPKVEGKSPTHPDYSFYKTDGKGPAMAYLKLIDLFCQAREDVSAHDEIYFEIRGRKIGPREVSERDPWLLIDHTAIFFNTSVTVRLYDEDTGIFDKDDFLGETVITRDLMGYGEQRAVFDLEGAHYTLTFKVENNPEMISGWSIQQLRQVALDNAKANMGSDLAFSPVVATKESKTRNKSDELFLDLKSNETLDAGEFFGGIRAGRYPGYVLSKSSQGRVYARAKPGTFPQLDFVLRYAGKRVDKYPVKKILSR